MCRSLDLTGPLLLGGVPNLPEDFPVRNRDFVGCMRNLRIDSRAIDMDSYIANNGTAAGETAHEFRGNSTTIVFRYYHKLEWMQHSNQELKSFRRI